MKVKFKDGPAAVLLDEVGEVNRGEEVEVSTEVGEQLLEQGWTQVGARKKTTPKKKTTPTAPPEPAKAEGETPDAASSTTEKEID